MRRGRRSKTHGRWTTSTSHGTAKSPTGSRALHAVIEAAGFAHSKSMKSYAVMMAVRLLEMKRILKETRQRLSHCDPTASHYLKLIMDAVFGKEQFRNEVAWCYRKWTNAASYFQRNHDTLLFYAGNGHTFNKQYGPPSKRQLQIRQLGYNAGSRGGVRILRVYDKGKAAKKIEQAEKDGVSVYYVDDELKGNPIPDYWQISVLNGAAKERMGYPTQKPLELLERIIKASSNEGDMILDPFCGCATACVAAERLNRQWAGIDLSPKAAQLVKIRIEKDNPLLFTQHPMAHRTDIPKRTDLGKLPNYRTHKHTLFGKQEGVCAGCETTFPFRNFTIDHIVPTSKGGSDHLDNLQLLCGACNSVKGNRDQAFLVAELRRSGIL